jgi:protein ImuB
MRRVLCLWLPRWPIDRRPRKTATTVSAAPAEAAPFAIVAETAGRRFLAVVDPAAAAAGLAPGMPLADALSFVPGLATAAAAPAEDMAALRRLAEWCGRYTPWMAPDGVDGVRLEITGCSHLWGGEEALAADLAARLRRQRVAGHIAIADTLGAAWAAARFTATGTSPAILPPGGAQCALAELPVEGLRLDPATSQRLRRVGLRHIGDLYPMPRDALACRFGMRVAERLDQALDILPEPLAPLAPAPRRRVRLSFAEPIADPADFARAAERLADDLVLRLAREGTGARRLDLGFHRSDGRVEHIRIGTARPSRDPRHLATLLVERLDTVDPGLGVEDMVLAAFAVEKLPPEQIPMPPLAPSLSLLLPPVGGEGRGEEGCPGPSASFTLPSAPVGGRGSLKKNGERGREQRSGESGRDWQSLAPLLDRLGNRFGLDALCRLEPHESHIPERTSVRAPVGGSPRPDPAPLAREGAGGAHKPPRPVRLLAPPEPVAASWLLPDDPPFRFTWRRRVHRVVRADGPERIVEEWWRPDGSGAADAVRDYYRVEDETGRRLWLFRAGLAGGGRPPRWFVHGVFA